MINYNEKILKRWQDYIQELYKEQHLDENMLENVNIVKEDEIGLSILTKGFDNALKRLKNCKALGIGHTPVKILKSL